MMKGSSVSIHVYQGNAEYYLFMKRLVSPLLDDLIGRGFLLTYFFIHYKDMEGPHVRIRFTTSSHNIDNLRSSFSDYMANSSILFPQAGSFYRYEEYDKELLRYHGPVMMSLAEEYFYHSSQFARSIIDLKLVFRPELRSNYGIFSSLLLALGLGFKTKSELLILFGSLVTNWKKAVNTDTVLVNNTLSENLSNSLTKIIEEKEIGEQNLLNLYSGINLLNTTEKILLHLDHEQHIIYAGDIIHMNANRLGLSNQEELILYHLLKQWATQ